MVKEIGMFSLHVSKCITVCCAFRLAWPFSTTVDQIKR